VHVLQESKVLSLIGSVRHDFAGRATLACWTESLRQAQSFLQILMTLKNKWNLIVSERQTPLTQLLLFLGLHQSVFDATCCLRRCSDTCGRKKRMHYKRSCD